MLRIQKAILLALVIIVTLACSLLGPLSGSSPQTRNAAKSAIVVWNVTLMDGYYAVSENNAIHLNSSSTPLSVNISFSPMVAENSNGKVIRYDPASAPNKVEYQLCFSTEGTCEPQGEWKSLDGINNDAKVTDLNPDWRNIKKVIFRARFRDFSQKPLLSLGWEDANYHIENAPQEISEIDYSVDLTETVTPTPLPSLSITQTYVATNSPVQGSIEVAPGTSVIGGTAGNVIQVQVVFSATSAFGKVTGMRVDDGDWETFVPQKQYTITILLNWSTVGHCVEYRDEKGNVSPRYCDNKGVEGSP
jgi:hypothetical protein